MRGEILNTVSGLDLWSRNVEHLAVSNTSHSVNFP